MRARTPYELTIYLNGTHTMRKGASEGASENDSFSQPGQFTYCMYVDYVLPDAIERASGGREQFKPWSFARQIHA